MNSITHFLILDLKKKNNFGGGNFFLRAISLGMVVEPSPQSIFKVARVQRLARSFGYKHTNKQTHRQTVILLLYYEDFASPSISNVMGKCELLGCFYD